MRLCRSRSQCMLSSSLVCVLICALTTTSVAENSKEHVEMEFRRGIQDAKLKFANQTFHSSFTLENNVPFRIGMIGGNFLLAETTEEKTKLAVIRVRNSKYAFELYRQPSSKSYSLSKIVSISEPDILSHEMGLMRIGLHSYYCHGWMIWDLIEQPGFQINSITHSEVSGKSLVECDFQFNPTGKEINFRQRLFCCKLKCDPSKRWAMTEQIISEPIEKDFWFAVEIQSQQSNASLPIVSKVTAQSKVKNVVGPKNKIFEFVAHEAMPAKEEMFYLSYYGMPEPKLDIQWFGSWVWYCLGGLFCLVVAFFSMRNYRVRA